MNAEHIDQRDTIAAALKEFRTLALPKAATRLFAALGYASDRHIPIATPKAFFDQLDQGKKLTERERETLQRLTSFHLLFQLTDAELTSTGDLFDDPAAVQKSQIHSYLFFAAELPAGHYTRTDLSAVARALNKPLPMPALLLLKHGDTVSLAIIHRRLNKRDAERDVLEKATLIKDIRYEEPIRAHLEILNDFTLANLDADFGVANFVALHTAWQRRLGSYALSNDFYREIADWYFWAHHLVDNGTIRLPQHCDTEQEKSLFLIRLLTRIIFCWFLVEKRLIPADLFRDRPLKKLIKDLSPDTSTYYHAVLQNLFFGTLNMPGELRGFREKKKGGQRYDSNYGITNLWRYETDFLNPADWLKLAERIPFLNGGLFDCLDDKSGKRQDNFILDGFSDNPDLACRLPNDLFFGPERNVDLSKDYGEEDKRTARSKRAKVRGLIEILSRYKFTIEENTPLEEEIALDPELLGKVFENLLASYNEDTRTTARKALGAFYTPREIVTYMVDEALKSYLTTQCPSKVGQTFLSAASLKVGQTSPSASSSDKVGQTFLSATSPDGIATSHRRLPHWHKNGAVYWVTFRLADSLPQDKLSAWKAERDAWRANHPEPWSEADWKEYDERFGERLEAWLDAGMGSRALARPDVHDAVRQCLIKFDGERLHFHAAVIMPTHLHALIEPLEGQDLSKLLKGIKGTSAREANKLLKTSGTFWLDESYDHIVRSEEQYQHFVRYIAENPAKAKLPASDYWLMDHQGGVDIPVCASQSGAGIPVCDSQGGADIPVCDSHSPRQTGLSAPLSKRIASLFSTNTEPPSFTTTERDALIAAIGRVKILDPACGSGAFPMGALHRLVDLLQKLDPNNELWKRDRLAEAERYCQVLEETGAPKEEIAACHARIEDITKSFDTRFHALDFARKLYLIENGIYGVDIQPVAVQIAKLRFFISLVVDQKVDMKAKNLGVRPLPNLETRLVAADTLIPLPKPKAKQANLFDDDKEAFAEQQRLKDELKRIRHEHFNARDPGRKRHWRDEDQRVREAMRDLLRKTGMPSAAAKAMSSWDPYDQNTFATFFDSEWMFGLPVGKFRVQRNAPSTLLGNLALVNEAGGQMEFAESGVQEIESGFDIVIGNPPYISKQNYRKRYLTQYEQILELYETAKGRDFDIFGCFIEKGIELLKSKGVLSIIVASGWYTGPAFGQLRRFIACKTNPSVIVNLPYDVFAAAWVDTTILITSKREVTTPWPRIIPTATKIRNFAKREKLSGSHDFETGANVVDIASWFTAGEDVFLTRSDSLIVNLLSELKQHTLPLEEFADIQRGVTPFDLTDNPEHPNSREAFDGVVRRYKFDRGPNRFLRFDESLAEYKPERYFNGTRILLREMISRQFELQAVVVHDSFVTNKSMQSILPNDASDTLFLLGCINSRFMSWHFLQKSNVAHRDDFPKIVLKETRSLPIPSCTSIQKQSVSKIAEILSLLSNISFSDNPADQSTRDPLMLAYFEQILNGLVYELYFPEEVHGVGLNLFDVVAKAKFPAIETIPEEDRLPRLRTLFETLYDGTHPLRIALDKLQMLDTVRIIEGKA